MATEHVRQSGRACSPALSGFGRSELALGELALAATLDQLAGEAELPAELLQLADGLRTLVVGLELDTCD
jgi:hypothetical protein